MDRVNYHPRTVWVGPNPYGELLPVKTEKQMLAEFRLNVLALLERYGPLSTSEIEQMTGVDMNRLQTRLATMRANKLIKSEKTFIKRLGGVSGRAIRYAAQVKWRLNDD